MRTQVETYKGRLETEASGSNGWYNFRTKKVGSALSSVPVHSRSFSGPSSGYPMDSPKLGSREESRYPLSRKRMQPER